MVCGTVTFTQLFFPCTVSVDPVYSWWSVVWRVTQCSCQDIRIKGLSLGGRQIRHCIIVRTGSRSRHCIIVRTESRSRPDLFTRNWVLPSSKRKSQDVHPLLASKYASVTYCWVQICTCVPCFDTGSVEFTATYPVCFAF